MGFGGPKIGTSIYSFHRAEAPKNEAPDGRLDGRIRPQWKSMESVEKTMKVDEKVMKSNENR